MMEPRIKWGIGAIMLLLSIMLFSKISDLHDEIKDKDQQLLQLTNQAQTFVKLKQRWDTKKGSQKLLQALDKVQAPKERFKKNKRMVLRYVDLNAKMLEKISHIILSSDIRIITFAIKKEPKGASLELEVEA